MRSARPGLTSCGRRSLRDLCLLAVLALPACGDDGVFVFRTNFGTVGADATCNGRVGQFPFQTQEGLTVIVLLDADSTILLASGGGGTCGDLTAGTRASVRGADEGDHIRAREVQILPS